MKRDFVDGSVVAIEDVSIVCSTYLNEDEKQKKTFNLQKSLFPSVIFIGMPFRLNFVKNGKLIKLVVTKKKEKS